MRARLICGRIAGAAGLAALAIVPAEPAPPSTGAGLTGNWRADSPGVRHHIAAADMPPPYATTSAGNPPRIVARPAGARLQVPPGFAVAPFAGGFDEPRLIRVAPNGDIFLAESGAGRIRVLHAVDGADRPDRVDSFAAGLDRPFGIAFWPPGPEPRYVYVAETDKIVRFPYRPGDPKPAGPAETVVAGLPTGGHWTRDVVFSGDGTRMFVAVGSRSNDADGVDALLRSEDRRAQVLVFTPDGNNEQSFATGLRNCVGMAIEPATGDLWCSTNERDGLGDDLVPDYVTRVPEGAFYGWPWFYIGGNQDPRHKDEKPELRDRVAVPDVLLQSHSAPLEMTFYDGAQFPSAYRGDAFVALHGSWNRTWRTGYKIVRVLFDHGRPSGDYQDFLTGFVVDDRSVWGRPVGVAVAHDGALLVTEDGGGTIWRVSYHRP